MWKRTLGGVLGAGILVSCESKPKDLQLPLPAARAAVLEPRALAAPLETKAAAAPVAGVPALETPGTASKLERASGSRCNEQNVQPFLVEAHFDSHFALGEAKRREWAVVLRKAVRYRTEQYGYVKGYGRREWNERTPAQQAKTVTFFDVPVIVHERIAPALACVETAIRERCAPGYRPAVLSGWRKHNTYLNGEISNHVYGIALDVDPTRNPCCHCVEPWSTHPLCDKTKDKFERMAMPRCWVDEFERFGFYWLGHDRIEDTMHFEFLADPNRIAR